MGTALVRPTTLSGVEILWWLAPAGVVTVLSMCWVAWLGRDGHGEVDRDAATARLARALSAEPRVRSRPPLRERERSTGIAVRPTRQAGPVQDPATAPSRRTASG